MDQKKPLICTSLETTKSPSKICILLHGYGDNAENFVSITRDLLIPELKINFYVPNAPSFVPQYPTGRQWFDLYPNGINFNDAGPKEKEMMKKDCESSLELIKNFTENLCQKFKLTLQDCFIIGFSQGAMMAFEFGKYVDKNFLGCALISGRILPADNHEKKEFSKTPIIIIHGDQDAVLEPKYFDEACLILKNQGYIYEDHLLENEAHTISHNATQLIKNFIKKNL